MATKSIRPSAGYTAARNKLGKGVASAREQKLLFKQLTRTEKAIVSLRESNPQGW